MACPFFQPTEMWDDSDWLAPPRLPLGDAHLGVCRAAGGYFEPAHEIQRSYCNRGYGRYGCGQFPPGATADAVRFSLVSDAHGVLAILYVRERDYGPMDHGRTDYRERSGDCSPPIDDPILRAQISAFVMSYQRRRSKR